MHTETNSSDANKTLLQSLIVSPYHYHCPKYTGVPNLNKPDDEIYVTSCLPYVRYKQKPDDAPEVVLSLGHLLVQAQDLTEELPRPGDDDDDHWSYLRSHTPTWFTVVIDLERPARPVWAVRDLEYVGWIPKSLERDTPNEEDADEDDEGSPTHESVTELENDKDYQAVGKNVLAQYSQRPCYHPDREAATKWLASINPGNESPTTDLIKLFSSVNDWKRTRDNNEGELHVAKMEGYKVTKPRLCFATPDQLLEASKKFDERDKFASSQH